MRLLALPSLLLLLACQGPEGPMGPAGSPKTAAAEQAADTTGCQVVINISGENVVYQGDNPDTNTVTVYDTVEVGSDGGSLSVGAFQWQELVFNLKSSSGSYQLQWIEGRKGWAYYDEDITTNFQGAFVNKLVGYGLRVGQGPVDWQPFDDFAATFDEDDQPSLTITESLNELFISDPNGVLEYSYDSSTSLYTKFFLGLQLRLDE